jgi:hypothetical protein
MRFQLSDGLAHRSWGDTDQSTETPLQLKDHSNRACHSHRAERQRNRGYKVLRSEKTKTTEQ